MLKENPLYSLIFNVVLPVVILNQLGAFLGAPERLGDQGPVWALLLALALPIGYGLRTYIKEKKSSWLAIFGLVNVLFTGGLALLQVEGIWFAVKEAAFPLLIGLFAGATVFRTPLMKTLLLHAQVLDIQKINAAILAVSPVSSSHAAPTGVQAEGSQNAEALASGTPASDTAFQAASVPPAPSDKFVHHEQLHQLFKTSTLLFSSSFFLSSIMNFVLAVWIFQPIALELAEVERMNILNEQVARMTWMGYVVIALPLSLFSAFIMWHLVRGLSRITGLEWTKMLVAGLQPPPASPSVDKN